ncbi:MAG TPA: protein phosphatase 2C domain-containing protein [Myxococcota bacterium]|nr:protein phosphatase 2C domain-containing protein [Myxococcota bacterium]
MLSASARTHAGRVRSSNEDAYVCHAEKGLFAVIDGMGGEAAGEVAAAIAARCIAELGSTPGFVGETLLSGAFQEARRRILAHAATYPEHHKLGAVGTAARLEDDGKHLAIAHVGDTRAYLVNSRGAQRLTTDHTMPVPGKKPAVARDLGRPDLPATWVDTLRVPVAPGDLLLLCSDGLYDPFPEEELLAELTHYHRDRVGVDSISSRLIATALSRGGPDNVTVVVVRITRFRRRKMSRRMGLALSIGVMLVLLGFVAGVLLNFQLRDQFPTEVTRKVQLREDRLLEQDLATQVVKGGTLIWQGARITAPSWNLGIAGRADFDLCALKVAGELRVVVEEGGVLNIRDCRLQAGKIHILAKPGATVSLQRSLLFADESPILEGVITEEEVEKRPPLPTLVVPPPPPPSAPAPEPQPAIKP